MLLELISIYENINIVASRTGLISKNSVNMIVFLMYPPLIKFLFVTYFHKAFYVI